MAAPSQTLDVVLPVLWAGLIGPWLILPLLGGKPLATAWRRLPVWIAIAAVEVGALLLPAPKTLAVVLIAATAVAAAETWVALDRRVQVLPGLAGGGALAVLGGTSPAWLTAAVLASLGVFLTPRRETATVAAPTVVAGVLAGVYFMPLLGVSWWLLARPEVLDYLLACLFVVHLGDIAGGFGGKLGGARPLPRLSPGKTVSGFVVAGTLVTLAGALLLPLTIAVSMPVAAVFGFVIWLASVLGDLGASCIKRAAGIKDFSHWLGPHGGVGDRVDSSVIALPTALILASLLA